jgi:hypothetical protein
MQDKKYRLVKPMSTDEAVRWSVDYIDRLRSFIAFGGLYNANDVIRIKEEMDRTKKLMAEIISIDI